MKDTGQGSKVRAHQMPKASYLSPRLAAQPIYPPGSKPRTMYIHNPLKPAPKQNPNNYTMQSSFTLSNDSHHQENQNSISNELKIPSSDRSIDENRITFDKLKVKMVRESENIVDRDPYPLLKFSKSSSHIAPTTPPTPPTPPTPTPPAQNQILVIKSDKKFSQTDDDNEEIQLLKEQIKEAERLNEKIKTENLELRLQKVKLSSDSTTMQILSLRKEIKDLRKKIQQLNEEKKKYLAGNPKHTYKMLQCRKHNQYRGNGKGAKMEDYDFHKNYTGSKKTEYMGQKYSTTPYSQSYKGKHSNYSNVYQPYTQFGLSHAKSIEKLTNSNQLSNYAPSTPPPSSSPLPGFSNNTLFNSQFSSNSRTSNSSSQYQQQQPKYMKGLKK